MDLMNLTDELKFGKLLVDEETNKTIILTPLFRGSWMTRLSMATNMEPGKPKRFTVGAIWNTDPNEPACVDLKPVVAPVLTALAATKKWSLDNEKINPIKSGKRQRLDGSDIEGYEEKTLWATFSHYPKTVHSMVPCYGADGSKRDPSNMESGDYFRAKIDPYISKKHGKSISIWLVSVQWIAEGEKFGGGDDIDTGFDALPGSGPTAPAGPDFGAMAGGGQKTAGPKGW